MVITTTLTLGTRETPKFVPYEFFDCVKMACAINQFTRTCHPDTIRYFVPAHQVVERLYEPFQEYVIEVDDATCKPSCLRRQTLRKDVMKLHYPSSVFDRVDIRHEERIRNYFLLLPTAGYYHTEIWRNWDTSHILYDGNVWTVHFREVYSDPHDTNHSVWFSGKPKWQVELECTTDFRNNMTGLKQALVAILPRAFKWHTPSGEAS
jgi:hypothetical protein